VIIAKDASRQGAAPFKQVDVIINEEPTTARRFNEVRKRRYRVNSFGTTAIP
jgi:hypothetical protein